MPYPEIFFALFEDLPVEDQESNSFDAEELPQAGDRDCTVRKDYWIYLVADLLGKIKEVLKLAKRCAG